MPQITQFDVYAKIAQQLEDSDFHDDIDELLTDEDNVLLSEEDRQVVARTIDDIVRCLNYCIKYNWPIVQCVTVRREMAENDAKTVARQRRGKDAC